MIDHGEHKFIPVRNFWVLKITMILFFGFACIMLGYFFGTKRMEIAQQFTREMTKKEYPVIALYESGQTFCVSNGNVYSAELIPRKRRSLMPFFKTVRED